MKFSRPKLRMPLAAFAAIAMLAALPAAAAESGADTILESLSEGGKVLLMRHANSPGGQPGAVGMTEGCILQPGRGLDPEGFRQARQIGALFAAAGAPIGAVFTSDMCRCWDTARLVAAGATVTPEPALKSTDPDLVRAFKAEIEAAIASDPDRNVLLVTHSNILPLYADWPGAEEIASGVVLVLDPQTWSIDRTLTLEPGATRFR